jgi:hypothetical protein
MSTLIDGAHSVSLEMNKGAQRLWVDKQQFISLHSIIFKTYKLISNGMPCTHLCVQRRIVIISYESRYNI